MQWLRAKTLSRLMNNSESMKEALMSAKDIMQLLREHGFSINPTSKYMYTFFEEWVLT